MRNALLFVMVAALAASASAAELPLLNPSFEDVDPNNYSVGYPLADWGPNGGTADHAGFGKPGYVPELGDYFAYMSAQTAELVGQTTAHVFAPNTEYTFGSWAMGGGDDVGDFVYQIGYDDGDSFIVLASATHTVDGTWRAYDGVTYTTGATGGELGFPITVRFGDGVAGAPGDSDIWFDNAMLTPEPTSLLLIGLGFLLRRR